MRDALVPIERGQQFLDENPSSAAAAPSSGAAACFPFTGLVAIDIHDFLRRDLPAREEILSPWLLTQSLNMIHSWRGVGKTHAALAIAYAVASGGTFLTWSATKPRKVLYIDGEMPATALQSRLAAIGVVSEVEPTQGMLNLVTPDL